MAEARARFRPSTVISTVAPRETPCGDTELIVGGVMRLPVGESAICWANTEVAMDAKTSIDLISALCKNTSFHAATWRTHFCEMPHCGADPLVRGRPPGRPLPRSCKSLCGMSCERVQGDPLGPGVRPTFHEKHVAFRKSVCATPPHFCTIPVRFITFPVG